MECKYFRVSRSYYYFYIAIEAIEEGYPGAYVAEVAWNLSNGARSLCKYVLTDYKPFGTLATSLFYLSSLGALGKTLCDFYEEKKTTLIALLPLLDYTQQPTAAREADRLEKIHVFTMEDLRENLSQDTKVLLPPDCNRKTNPARWTDPDNVYRNPYAGTGRPEAKTPKSFKWGYVVSTVESLLTGLGSIMSLALILGTFLVPIARLTAAQVVVQAS
nr:40S ribosomal protein S13 [Tanacetum cinerariifolium]